MLGKTTLFTLLLLGVACYQVTAQDEEERATPVPPPGPPGGPPRPPIEPVAPPSIPRPSFRRCTTQAYTHNVYKYIRHTNGRNYRCHYGLRLTRCAGTCYSTSLTNPVTLTPMARCTCCAPRQQRQQSFSFLYICRGVNIPASRRRGSYVVPVATACSCSSCGR